MGQGQTASVLIGPKEPGVLLSADSEAMANDTTTMTGLIPKDTGSIGLMPFQRAATVATWRFPWPGKISLSSIRHRTIRGRSLWLVLLIIVTVVIKRGASGPFVASGSIKRRLVVLWSVLIRPTMRRRREKLIT